VVDFIHVQYWPVFNVADALIVGGLALVVLPRPPTCDDAPGDPREADARTVAP
jgi:hypothetical protein